MTYRKLFYLLLVPTLVLMAGLWGYSMRNCLVVHLAPLASPHRPSPNFQVAIYSATVLLLIQPSDVGQRIFQASSEPASMMPEALTRRYGPLGYLNLGNNPPHGSDPAWLIVEIPIWLIWLIYAAGAILIVKVSERRAKAGPEHELAGQQAAADPAPRPD